MDMPRSSFVEAPNPRHLAEIRMGSGKLRPNRSSRENLQQEFTFRNRLLRNRCLSFKVLSGSTIYKASSKTVTVKIKVK